MRKGYSIVIFVTWLVLGCQPKQVPENRIVIRADSVYEPMEERPREFSPDTLRYKNLAEEILASVPKDIKPIFGYRFKVSGDFDGDGKSELLTERFVSGATHQEVNKFYEGLDNYDQLVELTVQKAPVCYVTADSDRIDTLNIASLGQLLGLSYLKNEGDLNGDGSDDLSYVVNLADWSSLNTWHIVTYKNKHWQELYRFPMWDWQLPAVPGEMDGGKNTQAAADAVAAFPGLVQKVKTNVIRVRLNDRGDEKDSVVNLDKLK